MSEGSGLERPKQFDDVFGPVLEALPLPLFAYDAQTLQILEANAEACRAYGYPRDEFVTLTIADIRPPEDVPSLLETVRAPHETGHRSGVWRHRRKDGSVREMDVVSSPVTFGGRPARLVVAIDVTEHLRTEREIQGSEARMRALLGSIDEIVFEFGADGTYLNVWTDNEDLLVAPASELVGRRILEMLGPETGRPFEETIARVAETGRPETIEYELEVGGARRWFLGRLARIEPAEDGPATVSFLARDVSERKRADEALHEAESRYRSLVEALPAMTYIELPSRDPRKTSFEYLSPQVESILGYTANEIMSRPDGYLRIVHPDDLERVVAENAHVEATGERYDSLYRLIAKDGRIVWMHSIASLVRDEQGEPRFWHGVALDVTAQKSAEGALREAEARYRTLVEQLPAVSFALVRGGGPADMFFTFLSPQVERIFGYPAGELLGDPARFASLVHPEDRERVVGEIGRASADETSFDSVFRVVRPDGSIAWLHGRAAPMFDERGGPLSWQGVALDVTQEHEAAEALRQAEERYRLVVENSTDLITLVEPDGTVAFASPSHEPILGLKPEEMVGRNIIDVLGPLNARSVREALAAAASGEQAPVRVTMTHPNGRPVVLESTGGQPILDERGHLRLILGITRDVTERVRAEREREELLSSLVTAQEEERARVASDIHDDPIQAMVAVGMQLDLLGERTEDPELLGRIERLRTSVRHAIDRLRRLLFELSPPSLESGLGSAIVELTARGEEALGSELRIDDRTVRELPIEARTAAFRIVQEALANVRKHAKAKSVVVRLEERDGGIVVAVEDDGIGIAEGTTSEPGHLGLRSMQERAALMGGWLEFGPRPGGGTYVQFWLPGPSRT